MLGECGALGTMVVAFSLNFKVDCSNATTAQLKWGIELADLLRVHKTVTSWVRISVSKNILSAIVVVSGTTK